jgi:hypothetical protein
MELTENEKRFVEYYTNYSKYYNDVTFRKLDKKWTDDGTKERMWISIYSKLSISSHNENLLFTPKFDEKTIMSEMDSYILNK